MMDLEAIFEKYTDTDFLEFGRVHNPPNSRPDLCAFLVLDRLVPRPGRDMVTSAEHDVIWLGVEPDKLAEVATEEDILTLVRCGVRYDSSVESLTMFV